jgi:hypothetical protein
MTRSKTRREAYRAEVLRALKAIEQEVDALVGRCDKLERELEELEHAGIANAGVHYRDGRYLYLLHSCAGGGTSGRRREYIGSDPERQKEALGRVERYRRHQVVQRELDTLTERLREVALRTSWIST